MAPKNLVLRMFAVAANGASVLFAPVNQARADQPLYVKLDPAQPTNTPGKIEVLEFFAYTCPHCSAIEPLVEKWEKTLPPSAVVHPVPVALNARTVDLQTERRSVVQGKSVTVRGALVGGGTIEKKKKT